MTAAMMLIATGLLFSLAAGPSAAARLGVEPYYFVIRHAGFAAGAVVILIGASVLTPAWARRASLIVFLVAFVLMAGVLLFGHEAKGAKRWIRLAGFSLQPSEFVKPTLIVLAAWLLAQRERYVQAPWALMAFGFYGVTVGLLVMQPDVGQSALLTAGFCVVFFVSGMSLAWGAGLIAGGAALGALLFATLPHVRARLLAFFDPGAHDTYQIDKAREALERGGLLGAGIGEGRVKTVLPDAHTDFIYSVIGEEYGLVVCFALILAFAAMTMRGMVGAAKNREPYPRAAAAGLFTLFGLQAAINIGVNVSLIPNKGMTLPLVSYGGSSMWGTALTLGLALALTRRPPELTRLAYPTS